jgi:N-acetyl-beta-hexosaminidase
MLILSAWVFYFQYLWGTNKIMTMTFKKISFFLIAALTTCIIHAQQAQQIKLIPEPSSLQIGNGTYKLPNQIFIQVPTAFESIGSTMSERLKVATGKKVVIANQKNASIRFEQVYDNAFGKEGYQLTINEKGIHVKVFYNYAHQLYTATKLIKQLIGPCPICKSKMSQGLNGEDLCWM